MAASRSIPIRFDLMRCVFKRKNSFNINPKVEVTARIEGLKPCTQYTFRSSQVLRNFYRNKKKIGHKKVQDGESTSVWGGGEGDHGAHLLRPFLNLLPFVSSSFTSPVPIIPSPPPLPLASPHRTLPCRHHRRPRGIGSPAQSGCQVGLNSIL